MKVGTVDLLEREIRRTENHLVALKDLFDQLIEDTPKRREYAGPSTSRVPLIEQALEKVKGTRIFSVKEITGYAQRLDPEAPRRTIYNCIKSYLEVSVRRDEMEKVGQNEYRRITHAKDD